MIALWSQLLLTLPNAQMVLGAMPKEDENEALVQWFEKEGIHRERLRFYPKFQMKDYLGLHHQVDVCLDTFPYNGGTTTLHALWMGVPTLSLAGNTAAGRTGASILGHVGLESFLAHNREDFVRKGLFWANNLVALSEIRAGLRDNLERSVIRQPTAVAAGLEHALRTMWQRWCAKLPPESFEVTLHDVGIDVP